MACRRPDSPGLRLFRGKNIPVFRSGISGYFSPPVFRVQGVRLAGSMRLAKRECTVRAIMAIAFLICSLECPAFAQQLDVTGKWILRHGILADHLRNMKRKDIANPSQLESYYESLAFRLDLTQSGEVLTGTISNPDIPQMSIKEGRIFGDKVVFSIETSMFQGKRAERIEYRGRLERNLMHGFSSYSLVDSSGKPGISYGNIDWLATCTEGPMTKSTYSPNSGPGQGDPGRPWTIQFILPQGVSSQKEPIIVEIYELPKGFDPRSQTQPDQSVEFNPSGQRMITSQVVTTAGQVVFNKLRAPLIVRFTSKSGTAISYYVASADYPFVVPWPAIR
jgi:hypothetical protein